MLSHVELKKMEHFVELEKIQKNYFFLFLFFQIVSTFEECEENVIDNFVYVLRVISRHTWHVELSAGLPEYSTSTR